ncbi:MAG: hypothetical protein QM802_00660 [Agriterribacter sp.]
MKHLLLFSLLSAFAVTGFAQSRFSKNEISFNAFRNPSIGLEYRYQHVSVHGGYYTTAFKAGEYTNFIKAGLTYWFLPVDKKKIPSSFYAGASFLSGLNRDYKHKSAMGVEAGFRWMIWKGLNVRLGAIGIAAKDKSFKINPTPGISYSFSF